VNVNSVQHQGKIVTKYFSSSFKYLCKTAVDWVNRIIMTLDEGHYYILVVIIYGKVSLWLWKSLENSGNFFSYFVATL